MVDQLNSLVQTARAETITVQIVRGQLGWHPGLLGPFVLYEFDDAPSIVLLEHYRAGAFVYEAEDVAAYKSAAEAIRRVAMSPEDSARLIAEVTHEIEATI